MLNKFSDLTRQTIVFLLLDMDQPNKNSCGGFSTTFADTHKRCTAVSMNPNKKQIKNLQQRSKVRKIKDQYSKCPSDT